MERHFFFFFAGRGKIIRFCRETHTQHTHTQRETERERVRNILLFVSLLCSTRLISFGKKTNNKKKKNEKEKERKGGGKGFLSSFCSHRSVSFNSTTTIDYFVEHFLVVLNETSLIVSIVCRRQHLPSPLWNKTKRNQNPTILNSRI